MRERNLRALGLGCALGALLVPATAGAATSTARFDTDAAGAQTLVRGSDGAVSTAVGDVTASTLGVPSGSATTVARAAVDRYAAMLGLRSGSQLHQVATRADADGTTVAYDQLAGAVPVYDGRVLVRLAKGAATVTSITSSAAQDAPATAGTATISAATARALAVDGIPDAAVNREPALVVYAGVPFGSTPATLAYVTDVRSTSQPLRQLVVTDAATGATIARQDRVETARNRTIYDAQGLEIEPGFQVRAEGEAATGDADADNAYTYTGATYD
ncbi:MAG: peptidase [Conexibacter sp.]|nr:peptidase [Conexibacter sp.]